MSDDGVVWLGYTSLLSVLSAIYAASYVHVAGLGVLCRPMSIEMLLDMLGIRQRMPRARQKRPSAWLGRERSECLFVGGE